MLATGADTPWDELDAVQQGVWDKLVKDTWNPTNPNFSGPVQRLVGASGTLLYALVTGLLLASMFRRTEGSR